MMLFINRQEKLIMNTYLYAVICCIFTHFCNYLGRGFNVLTVERAITIIVVSGRRIQMNAAKLYEGIYCLFALFKCLPVMRPVLCLVNQVKHTTNSYAPLIGKVSKCFWRTKQWQQQRKVPGSKLNATKSKRC